jgi:precorrin isomerase
VLLENPFYGNAAYIFNSDWTSLSKLSRTELTRSHRKIVERVSHASGSLDWKKRIKYKLELQS